MRGAVRFLRKIGSGLLLAAVLLLLPSPAAAAPSVQIGTWQVCDAPPWHSPSSCRDATLWKVDPQGRLLWLSANVRLSGAADEPAAVFLSAFASSAVYWDGRLIGTNGRPSALRDEEVPGLRDASFLIPGATDGLHRLTLAMSSHHALLRHSSPVMRVRIGPYERPLEPVLRDYLPALLTGGGLLMSALFFGFASWGGRWKTGGASLVCGALFAAGQLAAEASRAFIEYAYPAQILRICLVLAFAAGFAFMLLAYLARRFEVPSVRAVLLVQALLTLFAVTAADGFDQKTGLVLTSAAAIGLLLATWGLRHKAPGALPILILLGLGLGLSLYDPPAFLDRNLYFWMLGLFVLLIADQAWQLRRLSASHEAEARAVPNSGAPEGLYLGSGASRHFVLPHDIVRLAAADDYTEAFLVDGRSLLHPEPLQKLLARLPSSFVRVHRSHAVNLSHLRSFRKGPNSSVLLSDQSTAPVSRRSLPRLIAALEG